MGFWAAVCHQLAFMGQPFMAVYVVFAIDTYLRPSTIHKLRVRCLMRPMGPHRYWSLLTDPEDLGVASKTGEFDGSLTLDSKHLLWMNIVYEDMASRMPEEPLFPFTYPEFVDWFNRALAALKMKAVPYQLRHTGASLDRWLNRRSLAEVKRRGFWKSDRSVARYERASRLNAIAAAYPLEHQRMFDYCEHRLKELIVDGKTECLDHFLR